MISRPRARCRSIICLPEHAAAIIEFLDRWADIDRVVIHCTAGLRSSPGVALAIAELRGSPTADLERQFPLWNTWVREQLVTTRWMNVRFSKATADVLAKIMTAEGVSTVVEPERVISGATK